MQPLISLNKNEIDCLANERETLKSKELFLEADLIHAYDDIAKLSSSVNYITCENACLRHSLEKFLCSRKTLDDILHHSTKQVGKRGI